MTVTVLALVKALKGKEVEVKRNLISQVEPTRAEVGCINYDLHQSTENPCEFMFYENWTTTDSLKAHSQSPHILASRENNKSLLEQPTEISIWEAV